MNLLTVFLDANVLYSAGLRDLLMRLALQGLFRIKWTKQVHEEWIENLLKRRSDITREKLERTYQLMLQFAPDSLVQHYEPLIKSITLPDPDDRHVLAAAIKGKATLIVTFNLSDFPPATLQRYGIEAWHPDLFICHLLDLNSEQVYKAIRQHRTALKNPPKSVNEYLGEREEDGLVVAVSRLWGSIEEL